MFCAFSAIHFNVHIYQKKSHPCDNICDVFKNMVKKSQPGGEKEEKQILITNYCNSQILIKSKLPAASD